MSLNPQRLASIGLVCVAVGGFAWSEFSGKPVGPASASASPGVAGDAGSPAEAASIAEAAGTDCRVMLAGMLRDYAGANGLNADRIDDPFIEPASWTPEPAEAISAVVDTQSANGQPASGAEVSLVLTAVLDSQSGTVALVNGVALKLGSPVELPGMGSVELVEVGADGRSALVQTPRGVVRVKLNEVIGSSDA